MLLFCNKTRILCFFKFLIVIFNFFILTPILARREALVMNS